MFEPTKYARITMRDRVRKSTTLSCGDKTLDMELREAEQHEAQSNCITPPSKVMQDLFQFNSHNESLGEDTAEESVLGNEINKLFENLLQREECEDEDDQIFKNETRLTGRDEAYRKTPLQYGLVTDDDSLSFDLDSSQSSIGAFEQVSEMGNAGTHVEQGVLPKTTASKQTHPSPTKLSLQNIQHLPSGHFSPPDLHSVSFATGHIYTPVPELANIFHLPETPVDTSPHSQSPESDNPPDPVISDTGKQKLEVLSSTTTPLGAAPAWPAFDLPSPEILQQHGIFLSSPAPRPRHLSKTPHHKGLSPLSAERAIALDKTYANLPPIKMGLDLNNVPGLGILNAPKDIGMPKSAPYQLTPTAKPRRNRSESTSPIVHPHEVAAHDFGRRRLSMSPNGKVILANLKSHQNPRPSLLAGGRTSPFAAIKGGTRHSMDPRSSPDKYQNHRNKDCLHELKENDGNLLHYQLPTAQSRLKDIRNVSPMDSPTPARSSSSISDRGSELKRLERTPSAGRARARTRHESTASSSQRPSFPRPERRNSDVEFTKKDVEKLYGIPFSLDSHVGTAKEKDQSGAEAKDEAAQKAAEKAQAMDSLSLKSMEIEMSGVKKALLELSERLKVHENGIAQPGNNPSLTNGTKATTAAVKDKTANPDEIEKEAQELLEILQPNSNGPLKPSTTEIDIHLDMLSHKLKELEPVTSLEKQKLGQGSYAGTNTRQYGASKPSGYSVSMILWTSLVAFLTCVGLYAIMSVYLFMIEYTENTSTPY